MKTWFDIKAAADGAKQSEVMIFGEIGGWGVSAADFSSQLAAIPEDHAITVRINSGGGSVTEGYAIYNALKRRANVTTVVEGIAASMASVIMLAGAKIQANANSLIVIHNPLLMGATGNADELRKMADDIEKIGGQLVGIYVSATGKTEADVKAAMDAETMFTAEEAKAWGLIHDVIPDSEATGAQNMIAPMLVKMKAQLATLAAITAERDTLKQQAENSAAQIAALKVEADAAKSERDAIRAEIAKRDAEAAVSAAIAAGKLTEAAREQFVSLFIADPTGTRAVVDALRPDIGAPPVKSEAKQQAGKSDDEILSEFDAMPQGKAKDEFQRAHGNALLRAFRAKSQRRT